MERDIERNRYTRILYIILYHLAKFTFLIGVGVGIIGIGSFQVPWYYF